MRAYLSRWTWAAITSVGLAAITTSGCASSPWTPTAWFRSNDATNVAAKSGTNYPKPPTTSFTPNPTATAGVGSTNRNATSPSTPASVGTGEAVATYPETNYGGSSYDVKPASGTQPRNDYAGTNATNGGPQKGFYGAGPSSNGNGYDVNGYGGGATANNGYSPRGGNSNSYSGSGAGNGASDPYYQGGAATADARNGAGYGAGGYGGNSPSYDGYNARPSSQPAYNGGNFDPAGSGNGGNYGGQGGSDYKPSTNNTPPANYGSSPSYMPPANSNSNSRSPDYGASYNGGGAGATGGGGYGSAAGAYGSPAPTSGPSRDVPASLTTNSGGYRPGSTGNSAPPARSNQFDSYAQPSTRAPYPSDTAPTGGSWGGSYPSDSYSSGPAYTAEGGAATKY